LHFLAKGLVAAVDGSVTTMRMRARGHRQAGFTLVELMVVVALVGVVATLAARLYSRGVRGEAAPAFARSLLATIQETRHGALVLGRPMRLRLVPGNPGAQVIVDQWDPTGATWVAQNGVSVPSGVNLCRPDASVQLGTVTPTCPLTSGMTSLVCFSASGRVNLAATCPTGSTSTGSGATLYFASTTGDKKYRVVVWGLTGMAKLMDTW
jgi:prepilin-type N-terminal cleavage/methylation domain-containing protein